MSLAIKTEVKEELVSDEEVFQVYKIVDHREFTKGEAYKLENELQFDTDAMEKSMLNYAFRVRWREYDESGDTWEPIENFDTAMTRKLKKYCKKKRIVLPEGFTSWLLSKKNFVDDNMESSDGSDGSEDSEDERIRRANEQLMIESRKKKAMTERQQQELALLQKRAADHAKKIDPQTERQQQERAELQKRVAEHIQSLKDEEEQKKKKWRAIAEEHGKKMTEAQKDELATLMRRAAQEKRKKEEEEERLAKERASMPGPSKSPAGIDKQRSGEPAMSHYALVQKKKRRQIERKQKERERELQERKKEEKRLEKEKREKEKKKEEAAKKKEMKNQQRNEAKKTKEANEEVVLQAIHSAPLSTSFRIPKRRSDQKGVVKRPAAAATPSSSTLSVADERMARAKKRLLVVTDSRMEELDQNATVKENRRLNDWGDEEGRWRKAMYESGRWTKIEAIKDMPFNIRADRKETDVKRVRTLRRCQSTERLRHSFRRISAFHSMETMESEADSLAAALTEMQIGEKARRLRELHERQAEKEKQELNGSPDTDLHDLDGKIELFMEETRQMVNLLMLGEEMEETITELSAKAINAFLALDYVKIVQILEGLQLPECITGTILRLVRIFSPILNLSEAPEGCKDCCDEGEHRKCRMLITLLMALSEPHRMGDEEDECLLPPNTLYDAMDVSARCQLRALIRGGCTFDAFYDEEGKNAAHKMMEQCNLLDIVWLIERGLDVNSAIMPMVEVDLVDDKYEKPWKIVKGAHEKMAFVSRLHSQRLTARSLAWTKSVPAVTEFSLRPLTLVHTITPHSYFHRFAAVTLCNSNRKGFDRDDAVFLAVHAATVRQGGGLRPVKRSNKDLPDMCVPYFLIDRAENDKDFLVPETYQCDRARLTIHDFDCPSASVSVDLQKLGENGPTAVFKVPKKHALNVIRERRYTETLISLVSPPERSVILAQYFIVPIKMTTGKLYD